MEVFPPIGSQSSPLSKAFPAITGKGDRICGGRGTKNGRCTRFSLRAASFFALKVKKSKFLFDFLTLSVIIEPSNRKTVEGYLWNRINILRGRWLRSNRHSRLRRCAIIRKSRRHMCCLHLPKSPRDCSQRSLRSAVWICRCSRLVWRRSSPPSRACTVRTASAWGWIWCACSDVPRSSQSP